MRNYKFKFSSMIPSEWFHKLKSLTKPRKKHPLPSCLLNTTKQTKTSSESNNSLPHSSRTYFSTRSHTSLESKIRHNSPRNSLHVTESKRKTVYYKPSPPPVPSSSASAGFNKTKTNFLPNQDYSSSASSDVIDINHRDSKERMFKEMKVFDSTEKACPASNRTKPSRNTRRLSVKVNDKEDARRNQQKHQGTSGRRSSSNSPRIKIKASSPRVQVSARRSKSRSQSRQVLESFAVIKSSLDPKKDFRESMVEMIEENNIRASQDLRELLACYLSLNPKEYHDLILKVFVQVWLEVINSNVASK